MKHPFDKLTHLVLFAGGFIIVGVISITLQDLTDSTVYHVLLPGVITALPLLIWASLRQNRSHHPPSRKGHVRVSKTHRL